MMQAEDTSLAQHPYRGLVQAVCTILAVLIVAAICWCIWAFIAHRRLQAQIDAITALHQPFWETDFPSDHIPDEQNAAVLWKAVFAALPAEDEFTANSSFGFNDYPPFSLQWHQLEDRSIAANSKVFELAHLAAAKEADWGPSARSPFTSFPYFNRSRCAANILGDAILHAHLHGDDTLAIQRATDLLQLARADGRVGNIIARLVSIGIQDLCFDRLLCITPDLVIESDSRSRPSGARSGVPRKDVESLIRLILDESGDADARIAVIDCERLNDHQSFQGERKELWTLGPMIDLSEARTFEVRKIDRLAAAALSNVAVAGVYASNPTPVMGSGPVRPGNFGAPQWSQVPPINWAGAYEDPTFPLAQYWQIEWVGKRERRAAAISLAMRLYRMDHQRWPANPTELVPDYLPSVPSDPFAPGNTPIGYIVRKHATPDGQDRPVLYWNMVGDPEKAALPPNPSFCQFVNGIQWRDLSRWYPVVAPNTPRATSAATTESAPQTVNHQAK